MVANRDVERSGYVNEGKVPIGCVCPQMLVLLARNDTRGANSGPFSEVFNFSKWTKSSGITRYIVILYSNDLQYCMSTGCDISGELSNQRHVKHMSSSSCCSLFLANAMPPEAEKVLKLLNFNYACETNW